MSDEVAVRSPRRQWGAERKTAPMAILHPRPSMAKIVWGRIAILVTVLAWVMYVITTVVREFIEGDAQTLRFVLATEGDDPKLLTRRRHARDTPGFATRPDDT